MNEPTPIYLDNAATTPIADGVLATMQPFLEGGFGNPSSRHPLGLRAQDAVDEARRRVARATGAEPEGVVFTSGGTEANNLAVLGLARARKARAGNHVLVGPTEHASVRASAEALREEGFEVETLELDAKGDLDLDDLAERLRPSTVLVAVMLVNNEFGTIYAIPRAARIVRANAPQAYVHVDAVQGIGKIDVSLGEIGAHSLSLSAHKIHGPKGAGALVLADGVVPRPLMHGGGQEKGVRSGTENVVGIVGLGVAVEEAVRHLEEFRCADTGALRETLRGGLEQVGGTRLLEPGSERSPAIAAVQLPGPPAEVWMHHLEARGVFTSAGAACQAKHRSVPSALVALGLDEESAKRVLRFSFSRFTTEEEVVRTCRILAEVEQELGVTR